MNTDRLLTRVFDKQEKKMLYQGDFFPGEDGDELMFIGITLALVDPAILGSDNEGNVIELYIEDRFVPMMCWGLPDKNKKLIYEDDIGHIEGVFGCGANRIISVIEGKFCFKNNDNDGTTILHDKLTKCINIIGNRWENPELLEVKA